MVIIDEKKCIGCELCVKDCLGMKNLKIENGKAKLINEKCIECGHCVAVCPVNAISIENYDMGEVTEAKDLNISPNEVLDYIKNRRSVRQFKDKKVEHEKLLKIIEAGRYTPTARNSQGVSFVVVDKNISELRTLAMRSLKKKGEAILTDPTPNPRKFYAKMFMELEENYLANPKENDKLFFNAPAIIVIATDYTIDAGL
ncbi:MAG: nitroreductase family protein, partial [Fusobacteriaceae bacterium]